MKVVTMLAFATLLVQAIQPVPFARASSFEQQVVFFGDSLSDVGNDLRLSEADPNSPPIPPPTRYFDGRFSNGLIWADYLTEDLGLSPLRPSTGDVDLDSGDSVSFGYGAAGTGVENHTPDGALVVRGLTGQVVDFADAIGGSGAPDALYVVWSGANDYLLSMPPPPGGVPGIPFPPDPVATVGNIASAIERLHELGARRFLVPSLPDLGNIPIAALFGAQAQLTNLTAAHNTLLSQALTVLEGALPGASIARADVFALFQGIGADPVAAGFSSGLTDAGPAAGCLVPLPPDFQQDCSPLNFDSGGLTFWDTQHPTKELHRLVALEALRALGATNVAVDIRPRRPDNPVSPTSRGNVRVAILTTSLADGEPVDFDAAEIDVRSVRFGLTRAAPRAGRGRLKDVDRDGDQDLVLRFRIRDTGIRCGATEVALSGRTISGDLFVGADVIRTVRCGPACSDEDDDGPDGDSTYVCGDEDEDEDDD